jgi:ABC-2 type transport system ATP-binding protein
VLDLVGLTEAANRRAGKFSLGMRQRLALASAVIGDPSVLVLDEPFNGLDPQGIQTLRVFLRNFADNGGTVFLSSHLLAEIANNADDAIIVDHGRLVSAGSIADLVPATSGTVVTTPDAEALAAALRATGAVVERSGIDRLTVTNVSTEVIGRAAIDAGAVILGMRAEGDDLEAIFENLIHSKELAS